MLAHRAGAAIVEALQPLTDPWYGLEQCVQGYGASQVVGYVLYEHVGLGLWWLHDVVARGIFAWNFAHMTTVDPTVRQILTDENPLVLNWLTTTSEFRRFGPLINQLFPRDIVELEVAIMDLVPARNMIRDKAALWKNAHNGVCPTDIREIYAFIDTLASCRDMIRQAAWMQLKGVIPAKDLLAVPYTNWCYVAYVLLRFIDLMVPPM